MGGASTSGTDDGGHEIEQAAAIVIGAGQVAKAKRIGHGESVVAGQAVSKWQIVAGNWGDRIFKGSGIAKNKY